MLKKKQPQILFANINSQNQPTIIESVCVQCQKQGQTIILLTKIPFFRQLIISSFQCPHCGYRNNQVQFGGTLPDYGVQIMFRILSKDDLNRELIKSQHSIINFEELELEIPINGKAEINTIEGYLKRSYDELNFHQSLRKIHEPQNYQKLEVFLAKVKMYMNGQKFPLTVKVKDPSGNSNIKNPFAPKIDKNLQISNYIRSYDELISMGYNPQNAKLQAQQLDTKRLATKINFTKPFQQNNLLESQPIVFPVLCHSCHIMGQQRMCQVSIPYFSDLLIMSFKCQFCGAHSTQTKSTGEVTEKASILTLTVQDQEDLKRDLFKSETCAVELPDIQLELGYGTLGGVYTTVEGLLQKITDHFTKQNPFVDSDKEFGSRIAVLVKDLEQMKEGKKKFTMVLIDPLSHSFIQNPYAPSQDKRMKIIFRERTFDENQDLGLNDMKVENYKEKDKEGKKEQQKEQKKEQTVQKQELNK